MVENVPVEDYLPEIEVTLRDECITGGKLEVLTSLRRRISSLSREDRHVRKIYIGIGSGKDAEHALWRRYDYYKHEQGINEMIAVYSSSSQKNCRDVENELVTYYDSLNLSRKQAAGDDFIVNQRGGGGGRPSSQPYHYVYLAIRRLGQHLE